MTEYLKNLEIPGLVGSGEREYANPTGQSFVIKYPKYESVVLVRPFSEEWTGLSFSQELQRRKEAIELHNKFLPRLTLPQQQVVLQGESNSQRVPVLGRMMQKVDNVKPTSEIPLMNLLKDIDLCKAYKDHSFFSLKVLLTKGVLIDPGLPLGIRRHIVDESIFKNSNIMIGYESNGERLIFADPDWYSVSYLKRGNLRSYIKQGARLAANTVLYGATDIAHSLSEKFRRHSEFQIQNARIVKKRKFQKTDDYNNQKI